jgi:hypothetical protein
MQHTEIPATCPCEYATIKVNRTIIALEGIGKHIHSRKSPWRVEAWIPRFSFQALIKANDGPCIKQLTIQGKIYVGARWGGHPS